MLFEFDEAKSRHNKKKHGIDFVEAQALWSDADRIEVATSIGANLGSRSRAPSEGNSGPRSSRIVGAGFASSRSADHGKRKSPNMKKKTKVTAEELDRMFDEGEDIDEYIDWSKARRPGIAELAKRARTATGLSQTVFAERYQIPLSTFRQWEQGKRRADEAAINYLRLIAKAPGIIAQVLRAA